MANFSGKVSMRCVAALALYIAFVAGAHAQEFRIGFVSTDRIFREANIAKSAQTKLEQEFAKREKEIADFGAVIKTAADKFEKDSPTMSETQRATRQKQLVEQDRDFQRKRREIQEDLTARRNEELQQVLERANRVIRQIAESEKFDLILQTDQVVYINPKHDITEKVMRALNAAK